MSPGTQPRGADGAASRNRPPSPPWYGGVAALTFFASFGWVLAYSLGAVPGLAALGGWNYAVTAGLFVTSVVMIRFWRPG